MNERECYIAAKLIFILHAYPAVSDLLKVRVLLTSAFFDTLGLPRDAAVAPAELIFVNK